LTSLKIGDKSWYSEHIGMQRYEPYRRDENTGRIMLYKLIKYRWIVAHMIPNYAPPLSLSNKLRLLLTSTRSMKYRCGGLKESHETTEHRK